MIAKRPKPRTGGGMKLPTKKVRAPRPQDGGGGMRLYPVGKPRQGTPVGKPRQGTPVGKKPPRPQDSGGGMRPTPVGKKPPRKPRQATAVGKKPGGPRAPSQDVSKIKKLASSKGGLGKSRTGGTGGTRKKVMNQRLALQIKMANQRRTARPVRRRTV